MLCLALEDGERIRWPFPLSQTPLLPSSGASATNPAAVHSLTQKGCHRLQRKKGSGTWSCLIDYTLHWYSKQQQKKSKQSKSPEPAAEVGGGRRRHGVRADEAVRARGRDGGALLRREPPRRALEARAARVLHHTRTHGRRRRVRQPLLGAGAEAVLVGRGGALPRRALRPRARPGRLRGRHVVGHGGALQQAGRVAPAPAAVARARGGPHLHRRARLARRRRDGGVVPRRRRPAVAVPARRGVGEGPRRVHLQRLHVVVVRGRAARHGAAAAAAPVRVERRARRHPPPRVTLHGGGVRFLRARRRVPPNLQQVQRAAGALLLLLMTATSCGAEGGEITVRTWCEKA
jgi:hypothetical protein